MEPKFDVSKLEELERVAQLLLKETPEGAIVTLSGEVGLGKTTFVRKFLEQLYPDKALRVTSPSFVLRCQYFEPRIVEHFDFYRFETLTENDLWNLGYYEALENVQSTQGYLFIEWAEKVREAPWLKNTHELTWRWSSNGRELSLRSSQRQKSKVTISSP